MIRVGIADFKGLAHLRSINVLPEAYESDKDTVIVAHVRGNPIALMLARPVLWVHGLNLSEFDNRVQHRIQTRATEALMQYALGWGPAAPRLPSGCLFQIDQANDRMEAIANSLGGIEEENSRIFRLDL